jgi:hypothetical protein
LWHEVAEAFQDDLDILLAQMNCERHRIFGEFDLIAATVSVSDNGMCHTWPHWDSRRNYHSDSREPHMAANDFLIRAAKAAAQAARSRYEDDVELYYRIARAVLAEVAKPSSTMIDAAYEAVRFDEAWAIHSRRDFQKALRAMVQRVDRL